ncbi:FGGY-family carbohydrate kinase [Parahaliea aestuarii]|uniref:L-fuculose kinase n=1 Tax=Parahaliea aestuarii TaxID=1852021 RepID=A0A5C9A0H3_9GAMM|nr:FGGY family carbohydrate kinase [Parahaliea aestuarii]TXS93097.1 L-fuculose kinase [Parahaliea aestuarii]
MSHTFILDIGKTNIKGLVLDDEGATCWSKSRGNTVDATGAYPHFDIEGIWAWLLEALAAAASIHTIDAINVSTHGACAVLLDDRGALALPVMDYESTLPEDCNDSYNTTRPAFAYSLSPSLPAGLNLGRQLWWQRQQFPADFAQVATLLFYPQYWVWRLCGRAASERTSLGCHTDLWLPEGDGYSTLIDTLGLGHSLPPMIDTRACAGRITAEVAAATGLQDHCRVYAGVHDSNASFARYLASANSLGSANNSQASAFTVVSTGTWFVSMTQGGDCKAMDETRDMLANVDVTGGALRCARFMGGREYEAICVQPDGGESELSPDAIQQLVVDRVYALPAFASAGPFNGLQGSVIGRPSSNTALASLYLALMVDYELDLLNASGDVLFGSLGRRNPLLCQLLAALRPAQQILISGDEASTARGAWCLTRWEEPVPAAMNVFKTAPGLTIEGLADYKNRWRDQLPGAHFS